jgi:hypothetical protein
MLLEQDITGLPGQNSKQQHLFVCLLTSHDKSTKSLQTGTSIVRG